MERGAWWATIHEVARVRHDGATKRQYTHTHTHTHTHTCTCACACVCVRTVAGWVSQEADSEMQFKTQDAYHGEPAAPTPVEGQEKSRIRQREQQSLGPHP